MFRNLIIVLILVMTALSLVQCKPIVSTKSKSVIFSTKEYFDASRSRKIKIYIWQPANSMNKKDRSIPLVLFSHGHEGASDNYTWFTVGLAEKGFIVAGVDHENNTWYKHTPEGAVAKWDRPQDISYILTKLLVDGSFSEMIDKNKIAVAGHSAGGYAALALAGAIFKLELMQKYCDANKKNLDCAIGKDVRMDFFIKNIDYSKRSFKDDRIKAVFAMEPALGGGIDLESLKKIKIPVFIVGSKQNDFLVYNDNAYFYSQNIPGSQLMVLDKGEGHFIFIDPCAAYGKIILRQICADRAGVDRKETHKKVFEAASGFFRDHMQIKN